ncbi:hypothetical protein SADUNF_Sadunf14G0034900 [Salix dunnii]|uniref:Uncharacterized protein n=1 Tax=Salix dunnii TaxID=1413687 RepID=A0A835JHT6_9ROSI|nr:hypothetical protein SADUNF_Sadunf14G0034900 [Salix dunnii]
MTAKKEFKGSRTLSGEEEIGETGSGGAIETQWCWWWATASMAPLVWGVSAYKRGLPLCGFRRLCFHCFPSSLWHSQGTRIYRTGRKYEDWTWGSSKSCKRLSENEFGSYCLAFLPYVHRL